jgi:mannose-1-phosphate guanylyltransferase
MFAFRCDFLIKEFQSHAAGVIQPFETLQIPDEKAYTRSNGLCVLDNWTGLEDAYRQTENISFDYAIAEKCANAVMVQAAFEWTDVGNWDEYACLLASHANGNNTVGAEVYTAGKSGGYFVDSDIPVALVGVEDIIVVIRSGKDGSAPVALVVKKGETQHVKDIVEQIKKTGRTDLL